MSLEDGRAVNVQKGNKKCRLRANRQLDLQKRPPSEARNSIILYRIPKHRFG
jgi:hypothetical protein